MVSVLGGATLSFPSTSIEVGVVLSGSTVVKSGFAFVGFLLIMRGVTVRILCVPLWLMTWVTLVCVHSLPTSVIMNWTAVMESVTDDAREVASGTNPSGVATLLATSQAPS